MMLGRFVAIVLKSEALQNKPPTNKETTMTDYIEGVEPAFPGDHRSFRNSGVSVRDYFMAHAPSAPLSFVQRHKEFNSFATDASAEAAWRREYVNEMLKARKS